MGFKTADMPPVDPAEFESMSVKERYRLLCNHWAEYGTGGPVTVISPYLVKALIYVVGGWLVVGLTTSLSLTDLGPWWGELIVWQKLIVWTVLWEATGYGGSWGPLAFKYSPKVGGWRYYARLGTLRVPPFRGRIPGTSGSGRAPVDVVLYLVGLATLVFLLLTPGVQGGAAYSDAGLLPGWALVTYIVLLVALGLRDQVAFLASRADQYAIVLLAFGVLSNPVDMILFAKLAMLASWVGAGVSKLGHNFAFVVPVMTSNAPWTPKWLKKAMYRRVPDDLIPSKLAVIAAHVTGTLVEIILPLVLLFSTHHIVTWLAIVGMVLFHIFIFSCIPVAVPLEWNVLFGFGAVFLFGGFFAGDGYGVSDFSNTWILAAALILYLTGPVLGNLKPEWVSFLISMRQYAGNWAGATMAFRTNDCEDKLDVGLVTGMPSQRRQLVDLFGSDVAEIFLQRTAVIGGLHTHGRMHLSLLEQHVDQLENYRLRQGEAMCASLVGWSFGDGHFFNEDTIAAVQERCGFEPGEFIVAWNESQPIYTTKTRYKVIDAALGVVERGYYDVRDARYVQPWLPDGPLPCHVTWRAEGYEPRGDSRAPLPQVQVQDTGEARPAAQPRGKVVR